MDLVASGEDPSEMRVTREDNVARVGGDQLSDASEKTAPARVPGVGAAVSLSTSPVRDPG